MKATRKPADPTVGLTARDIMSPDVVTVVPSMHLRAAAGILRDHRITGAAVVTETGRLIGVLSETDLVERESQPRVRTFAVKRPSTSARNRGVAKTVEVLEAIEQPIADATVGEVFSPYVITARPEDSVPAVAALMVRHQVHRLFVMEGSALLGVISSMDVMKAVAMVRERRVRRTRASARAG